MATPPECLTSVAANVDGVLNELLSAEQTRWHAEDPRLGEALEHLTGVIGSGGKRLRAAFCYWGWDGACSVAEPDARAPSAGSARSGETTAIRAGAAFEMLQAFALIHDDIMDNSPTRRGMATIHTHQAERVVNSAWRGEARRYGEGIAILVGDLAHVYADQLIGVPSPETKALWDELRIELNLGQYLDLRAAAAGELDTETAQSVSMFKSALYTIVRPLQLGASLAPGYTPALADQLAAVGLPLGRAFQLRDDLLGVLGSADEIGKPVGDDLREGKPTELVAEARQRAGATDSATLDAIGTPDLSESDVAGIVGVMHSSGAVDAIETRINDLVRTSLSAVDELPFAATSKETLGELADYVAERTH